MKPIRHVDDRGVLLVRDSVVLAFFWHADFRDTTSELSAVFDAWRAAVPPDSIRWALLGASKSESKPVAKNTFDRCREMLDPAKAAKRPFTAFTLSGPEEYNPSFQFDLSGENGIAKNNAVNSKTNLIEMRFPVEHLQKQGADAFVEFAVSIARLLSYDSGYGSPALNWSSHGTLASAVPIIAGLAMRHPGFDIHDNNSTRIGLGRRSRGARWLTFLGPALLKKLGGRDKLAKKLDAHVQVIDAGDGIAIRAGKEPALGDVNKGDNLPLLLSVADAIEPVTRFDDIFLKKLLQGDPDKLHRWERRFLD